MKRFLVVEMLAITLVAGCMVGPGPNGSTELGVGLVVVPALPSVVVLEAEPYYQHADYYYYYQGDRWSYSRSRSGPWTDLPRDRYPKEVKYKNQGNHGEKGENHGQEKKH
jgi:hypothetical protein